MSNKLRIPVILMVLTIIVITGFQVYWLAKNFRDEKRLFEARTNMLFRETLFQLQASKLKLAPGGNVRIRQKADVISMVNVLKDRVIDSSLPRSAGRRTMVVALDRWKPKPDRAAVVKDTGTRYIRTGGIYGNPVVDFLVGVDSLQDSITIKEVTAEYKKGLQKEKIDVPFNISLLSGPAGNAPMPPLPDVEGNKVTIGFVKPVTYQLDFENTTGFLLKKLGQPIMVSSLLVGITIFSFLLLFRNIVRQRKLTQLKNDFISNITHELKTPIATVVVAIEALKDFNALEDPKRTREYLDISTNELQRLSLLVDKVLKLSMFEKNKMELKKEWFDLKDLVTEVIVTLRPLFEKQQATVTFNTSGSNFSIKGDRLHLTSVVYNLLDNALKYSDGSAIIHIQLSLLPRDIFELKVSDRGPGIPREYRFKVFTKFFRVPSDDKHNIKGYGLGLSYVSEVVKRHQGYIVVDSEPGAGSTFIVKMPVEEKDVIFFDEHRQVRKVHFKLW